MAYVFIICMKLTLLSRCFIAVFDADEAGF
jgi:hypothetical protein